MRAALPILPIILALSLVVAVAVVARRSAERGELPVLNLRSAQP